MCTLNFFFFFFNDTATTEIYTLSLHDALPILRTLAQASDLDPHLHRLEYLRRVQTGADDVLLILVSAEYWLEWFRSEEHTSELQSRPHLVCRLLLEKKKNKTQKINRNINTITL